MCQQFHLVCAKAINFLPGRVGSLPQMIQEHEIRSKNLIFSRRHTELLKFKNTLYTYNSWVTYAAVGNWKPNFCIHHRCWWLSIENFKRVFFFQKEKWHRPILNIRIKGLYYWISWRYWKHGRFRCSHDGPYEKAQTKTIGQYNLIGMQIS